VKASTATVAGVALVFVLAYVDAAWDSVVMASTVVIGPFLTAIFASWRATAAVAAFAVASAILSGGYNHNYGTADYVVRIAVVLAGGAFAILGARALRRLGADQRRFALLRGAAEIADAVSTVDDVVARVGDLLVPALADVCVIDVLRDGRVERLAIVGATGDQQAGLRRRGPPALETVQAAQPLLAERIDEQHLRRYARDEGDLAFLRGFAGRSHINVPLRSRGRTIGTLALLATTRTYRRADLDLAVLVAGRVGLALDNAGLFAELGALQRRLTTALETLAEAVVIQDADGAVIYANGAARDAFGALMQEGSTQPILDAYDLRDEHGAPLPVDAFPGRRALHGDEAPEPLLLRMTERATGEERWRLIKASNVPVREGEPRLAVNVVEDVTDVKRAELGQRFLAEAGAVLASAPDYEATLARVAELAVPRLADWCAVSLPDGDWLRTVALAHVDPAKRELAQDYQRRHPTPTSAAQGSAQVLRDGTSQLVGPVTDELLAAAVPDPERHTTVAALGLRWAMLVPMRTAGRTIGVIALASSESGRRFTAADLELAEELGRRAGAAVEAARAHQERAHIAAALQRGLLPDALPEIPGVRLASLYRPAGEQNLVGGDFYDAFPTASGWMLLVGDVTGRGAEAAALTGQARHTLRTAGTLLGDPEATLEQLNHALAVRAELTPCTVVLLRLEPAARAVSVVCAGHPQPLLIRDGAVRPVGRFGPMLGAWTDSRWHPERVELRSGDVLVAFSDGVTDTVGANGRFGDERLLAALEGVADAAGAVAAIDAALSRFQRGPQADDTAVLALDVP